MKRIVVFLMIVGILLMSNTLYADTALKKLGRGTANILTCPIELIYRVGEANEESGPFAALTWGLLNGVYRMGMRGVVGVYEVVTFPIAFPA